MLAVFGDIVSWSDKLGGGGGGGEGVRYQDMGNGEIYIEKLINPLLGVAEVVFDMAA